MRLLRVQVPSFRVLKDVDIKFEKDFDLQVFPLGSLNGGGKSTLLQLIFILLHCSTKDENLVFLKNTIKDFKILDKNHPRTLAIIDILFENKIIQFDFFVCDDSYTSIFLKQINQETSNNININKFKFSDFSRLKDIEDEMNTIKKQLNLLTESLEKLREIEFPKDDYIVKRIIEDIFYKIEEIGELNTNKRLLLLEPKFLEEAIIKEINRLESNYTTLRSEQNYKYKISKIILQFLSEHNFLHITNYLSNDSESTTLICRVKNFDSKQAKSLLDIISNKIFLAAPSTNVFLFINQEIRKLLFKVQNNKNRYRETYSNHIHQAKDKISGLFTYDFLSVDLLIDSFKAARDKDFKEAIEKGEYGNYYKTLVNNLKSILSNTQLTINPNLLEVVFKVNNNEESINLYPEDLSHGELKRLSIYMWLTYLDIKDSIVLMDEIEIALHPDWQYNIVSDLIEWAPTNQYILATHSYELCRAVTPAHVKELEPRLFKKEE